MLCKYLFYAKVPRYFDTCIHKANVDFCKFMVEFMTRIDRDLCPKINFLGYSKRPISFMNIVHDYRNLRSYCVQDTFDTNDYKMMFFL